jgi:hypothetical protein
MLIRVTLAIATVIVLFAAIPAPVIGGRPAAFAYDASTPLGGLASGGGNLIPLW